MFYGLLADLVVAFHLAYMGYVAVGQVVILLGMIFGWKFIRNPWFRWSHLLMICVVAVESISSVQCPLTTLEYALRDRAGQRVDGHWKATDAAGFVAHLSTPGCDPLCTGFGVVNERFQRPTFVGRLLHDLLFLDIPYDDIGFTIAYVSFALLVIASFVLAPPRPFAWRRPAAGAAGVVSPTSVGTPA